MKVRADVLLFSQGFAESREKAQAYILAGEVYLGEKRIEKASEQLDSEAVLSLRGHKPLFASRGGYKLAKAIDAFEADVSGLVAMDIGAASGGFTDVLLQNGAAHVYAIDVGYGQFDWKLRNDSRVTLMERTNARTLTPDMFPIQPKLTVMDVSFISIRLILPVAAGIMGQEGRFLTLIKPQFEAGKGAVGKHGVVREPKEHVRVLREIRDFVSAMGWRMAACTFSPIKGPAGNIEFLADLVASSGEAVTDDTIERIVRQAHAEL
ncbi:MAG: TlyA family RNA methyltransferase [Clostridia bacterium]|nr:TlyA family RNA methyltransferase [Clostridia bacterium]